MVMRERIPIGIEKVDDAYRNVSIENPWHKYKDRQERRFIRSRYHKKRPEGELVTDPKVVTDMVWFTTDPKVLEIEKQLVKSELKSKKISTLSSPGMKVENKGPTRW
ncbi:hypothetical protein QYE76_065398 [Lolium multiflorum]|uniref:Uncharacterized protein n=1 Tax=Lolium multiflorum TaxID=4521 RepID=A0AAD8SA81_LOLMU|nr:hypothetical protein QYE76_065398 [Lolium multiflorum]